MKKSYFLVFSLLFFINCSKDSNGDGTSDTPVKIDKSANLEAPGDSAMDLLSNDNYDKILLEIGYVAGFKPDASAINDLIENLKERTFKQIVEVKYLVIPSPAKDSLSLQEVADLESENRTAYSSGSTIAIYIYFSDAPSDEDKPEEDLVTLGAVFRNTSMVIYESTVQNLANKSLLLSTATVETATLLHEFGHLFGLVHLNNEMVNPHEGTTTNDKGEEVPSQHCNQEGCLMRAELEFGSAMGKMLEAKNGQVPDLDAECLLDLKSYGGR